VASWLFFRVAHSSRIDSDMLVVRALKNSQLTDGESHVIYGTGHELYGISRLLSAVRKSIFAVAPAVSA
jgi:hypothetical protein